MAEILNTTDVSQWRHVSGINNPADIGMRVINIDELRKSEWLIWPAWLKRPQSEWPEQVNLVFASDEDNIPSSVFMTQADEKEAVIQWERFSNFNRLVNTMAYVWRAFSKYKPATLLVSVEKKEKAKQSSSIYYSENSLVKRYNLSNLKRKSQKAEKYYNSHLSWLRKDLFVPKAEEVKINWALTQNIQYCYIGNIMQLNCSCETSTRMTNTKAQSISETFL